MPARTNAGAPHDSISFIDGSSSGTAFRNRSCALAKRAIPIRRRIGLFGSADSTLATHDAHGLYQRFGFAAPDDRVMQRRAPMRK